MSDIDKQFAKAQSHYDNECMPEQFECPDCGTIYEGINPLDFKCDECDFESESFDPES